ncbi:MAG: TonB-dependent receptor [Bacteroidota bacterium]
MRRLIYFFGFWMSLMTAAAQSAQISGVVSGTDGPLTGATVLIKGSEQGRYTDDTGAFSLEVTPGPHKLVVRYAGHASYEQSINVSAGENLNLEIELTPLELDEVVISGTLKAISRDKSPVPVEVYRPSFFKKNPTTNVFEALQNVNGVRPQLNCNVCNTGDIHINGLEGPYTMVLLDGMPIVSGLSTVYGLSGIPTALIERVEIVKGPASSLYGSEAVGGLINIITKSPDNSPRFSADVMGSTWQEWNADLGLKLRVRKKADVLTGINLFRFNETIDNNGDNFTDLTLQQRVSIFQKWSFQRSQNRVFTLAGRYYYEDRWGGELNWAPKFRGGDEVYGESIRTSRVELMGSYQLPVREHMMFSFSWNQHDQNSVYGDVPYIALQRIGFGQLTWDKHLGTHELLAGAAVRHTFYDDNTPATAEAQDTSLNQPDRVFLPGLFVQDQWKPHENHTLLMGMRLDYDTRHGFIPTPRLAYRWALNPLRSLRLNVGTGFRVVNLFTEDHAALTGARRVIIGEELAPERSYNANLSFTQKLYGAQGGVLNLELNGFYTYFTNQIVPDYDTNPNWILYDNLDGYSVASGISANIDWTHSTGISLALGATLMDNYVLEDDERTWPVLNERFNGTFALSVPIPRLPLKLDYTGNLYGPMRLPLLSELDPRDEISPWWSLQNIQLTYSSPDKKWELYGGVKNLLNFTPPSNSIARPHDPFDRLVAFGADDQVLPTADNPYALTFDPSYVYAPNQGIRGFLGVRYLFR